MAAKKVVVLGGGVAGMSAEPSVNFGSFQDK